MNFEDFDKMQLVKDIKEFIEKGAENLGIRVFPQLYPYSSSSKNENVSSTAGDDGEKRVHEALREFVIKNEGWFLFHSIGKAFKTWLQNFKGKLFDKFLKEAKTRATNNGPEIKEGFDPDFILINKTKGIFMIDSKNVNENSAEKSFKKAINQCKIFKSFLEILFEAALTVNPFDKINFKMGAYIPNGIESSRIDDTCFVINDKELDDVEALKFKFSVQEHVDEQNDNYDRIINFLVGIKIKYDEDMCVNPTKKIDIQLEQKTNSEVKVLPSLVKRKVIINGPAGTGKTYRLMDNIINLLTHAKRIGLVYSDDVYENTLVELNNKKVKIFNFLKEFNKNIQYKSVKLYLLEETILLIIKCDDVNFILIDKFNKDFLAIIGSLKEKSVVLEFIVEIKYLKVLNDTKVGKSNISTPNLKRIKQFLNDDIGDSIIFIEKKYKEINIKDKLTSVSGINVFEVKDNSNIMNEYESNNIILCFAPLFSIEMIKKRIKEEKKKLTNSIKYHMPCEFVDLDLKDLQKLSEINFYFLNKQFVLFVSKSNENEFYYDFIDYTSDFISKCFNKLRDLNDRIKIKFYTLYYEFIDQFLARLRNIYKNSFFYIPPCDFEFTLSNFEMFLAFKSVNEIHIFADDIMSSINTFSRARINQLQYDLGKNSINKIKTFLITFDSNQFFSSYAPSYDHSPFVNIDFDFEVENLNKVYRCNKKIFDYIKPFYEFSNYLKYEETPFDKQFESFLEYKEFIIGELKDKKKLINENKRDLRIKLSKYTLRIIVKQLTMLEIECGNSADGFDVVEIGVCQEELFKTIENAINEAIKEEVNINDILVVINDQTPCFDNLRNMKQEDNEDFINSLNGIFKNEDFDLKTGLPNHDGSAIEYCQNKAMNNPSDSNKMISILLKYPNLFIEALEKGDRIQYLESLLQNLKSNYPKCKIIKSNTSSLLPDFKNSGYKDLYSSEFKRVIYVVDGDFSIRHDSSFSMFIDPRLDHYLPMSRATMNLKIIYVKEIKI